MEDDIKVNQYVRSFKYLLIKKEDIMYTKDKMILQSLNLIPKSKEPITGYWGTAHFTFKDGVFTLNSSGTLKGPLKDNSSILDNAINIININNNVMAPQNSQDLFSKCYALRRINGLRNLDTSSVKNMSRLFFDDDKLYKADYCSLNTSHVINKENMFYNTSLLLF